MSEFRKDMRKDIGNKKIAIVQSLVEVSGFIANLIDIIDGHSNEIDRLTAELAAKEPDWTPITSVEQVEGLAEGYYELRDLNRDDNQRWAIGKKISSQWNLKYQEVADDDGFENSDIETLYTEYKLIRAFEPAAPSIPEWAIENTTQNRIDAKEGLYVFVYPDLDNKNVLLWKGKGDYWHYGDRRYLNYEFQLTGAKYFYPTTENELSAALEALAKGERSS